MSDRGMIINQEMTNYAGASYKHFQNNRLRCGFNLRCIKDY